MIEIKAPAVGESISEVRILDWTKKNGDYVKKGEVILEIESDKASVEVIATANGVLKTIASVDDTVAIGETVAQIDESASAPKGSAKKSGNKKVSSSSPQASSVNHGLNSDMLSANLSPAVKKMVVENGVDVNQVKGNGKAGRLTKGDVKRYMDNGRVNEVESPTLPTPAKVDPPGVKRSKMSSLRRRIAQRLVSAQQTAAILTTFNEVDLTNVMELRSKYKEKFKAKNGVNLGFMSFFTRACVLALKENPDVNGQVDGEEIVNFDFVNMGVAVGTEKGLVVPVLKNADKMTFLEIEQEIVRLATKAKAGKLSLADMSDGTFTISNGGVYGSMLSTPILNPPQSGILGMHNIMKRPIAVGSKIEIRPMMYLALSYDHRIIDGKGAVTFLVAIKDKLENPESLDLDFKKDL